VRQDLTGRRFGRWTVLRQAGDAPKPRNNPWLCRCRCGTERPVQDGNLLSGKSRSCGCTSRKHGMRKRPEYYIWQGLRRRCLTRSAKDYYRYGGKGIVVCKRWNSFVAFLDDMGPRPSPGYTIDRKDGSKGYSPGNCRWATAKEQNRNKPNNHLLTFRGETHCIAEWAEILGWLPSAIALRLRRGWSVNDTLSTPIKPNKGGRKFQPVPADA
jgi:hypothetical protein